MQDMKTRRVGTNPTLRLYKRRFILASIEEKVTMLLKDKILELGYELYDVEYAKEGKNYFLRIFIDKEEGIDLNDCEKVNDGIVGLLDEADYIKEQYFLEVSSAGLEKKLRKKEHFEKQIGNKIEVNLYSKIDNKKNLQGILKEYNDKFLLLEVDGKNIEIDFEQVANAKTVFDW